MDACGILHLIETDLSTTWIDELARDGVRETEDYLAKHLAFLTFLDEASYGSGHEDGCGGLGLR